MCRGSTSSTRPESNAAGTATWRATPVTKIDGIEGEELTLNHAGYPTDVTNLDASGARTRDSSGVTHYVRTLDAQGRLIVGRRIGMFGQPITDDNGYYETHTSYDEQGRAIERSNHDAEGNLLDNNDGFAIARTTYTIYPDSTQVTTSYFDASGLAVEEKSGGAHQVQRTIDQRGFTIDEAYFDTTGAPTLNNDGEIHEWRADYDRDGNLLAESYFGVDGKPKDQRDLDYARVVYQYDEKNRVIEKAYFGDDGTPQVPLPLGAAIIRQEYDAQGSLVRRQFFDGQGHPSPHVLLRLARDPDQGRRRYHHHHAAQRRRPADEKPGARLLRVQLQHRDRPGAFTHQ